MLRQDVKSDDVEHASYEYRFSLKTVAIANKLLVAWKTVQHVIHVSFLPASWARM